MTRVTGNQCFELRPLPLAAFCCLMPRADPTEIEVEGMEPLGKQAGHAFRIAFVSGTNWLCFAREIVRSRQVRCLPEAGVPSSCRQVVLCIGQDGNSSASKHWVAVPGSLGFKFHCFSKCSLQHELEGPVVHVHNYSFS